MPTMLPEGCLERFAVDDQVITALTADGGCRLSNPSPYGGMWAFRHTNAAGEPVAQAAGVVTVAELFPLTTVSNNVTETLALLIGLEALPDGWAGKVRSDSLNALRVFTNLASDRPHLTAEILARCRAVGLRLGKFSFELLAGHPTKKELALLRVGQVVKSERGYPYCLHNFWADGACVQAWHDYEGAIHGGQS